jgi:hypothetical protein
MNTTTKAIELIMTIASSVMILKHSSTDVLSIDGASRPAILPRLFDRHFPNVTPSRPMTPRTTTRTLTTTTREGGVLMPAAVKHDDDRECICRKCLFGSPAGFTGMPAGRCSLYDLFTSSCSGKGGRTALVTAGATCPVMAAQHRA